MRGNGLLRALVFLMLLVIGTPGFSPGADNPDPPGSPVKLIFIHHSCGENWLVDGNGGLGIALRDNNLFVSDTNYGWGPDGTGDQTDIGHWWNWFRGPESGTILSALYPESGRNSDYSGMTSDPGGENQIIMFKSCFPNSFLGGNPDDPPTTGENPLRGQGSGSEYHTVGNAKGIYNDILEYFATRQDKLFIVVTAPPLSSQETNESSAANARALNDWLVHDWLQGYPHHNVAVFDFFNVLTSNGGNASINDAGQETGNHHRWWNSAVQHLKTVKNNTAAYPSDLYDSHPTSAGNQKATAEFVPLLNVFYHRWKGSGEPVVTAPTVTTGSAASVTSGSATVAGTINPNGGDTIYYFEYGASTAYGYTTTTAEAGSGTSDVQVQGTLSGLNANTAYHYRIVAENSAGRSDGDDRTFVTPAADGGIPDSVVLTVQETAGIERVGEYVSFGLPLPRQWNVTEPSSLRLREESGTPVPAQFEALARWGAHAGDSSAPLKWILIGFFCSLPANGAKTWQLDRGGPGPSPATQIGIDQSTSGKLVVNTGAAQFEINRNGSFNLFNQVTMGGQNLLQSLTATEAIHYSPAGDLSIVPGGTPNTVARLTTATLERNGPLYAVVKVTGSILNQVSNPVLDYTARLHFFAGMPEVRVDFTVENNHPVLEGVDGQPINVHDQGSVNSVYIGNLKLGFQLQSGGGDLRLLAEQGADVTSPASGVRLYQDSSGTDFWDAYVGEVGWGTPEGPNELRTPRLQAYCTARGFEITGPDITQTGDQALGWMAAFRPSGPRVVLAVKDFWQNFPKAIEAETDGKLAVDLFPNGSRFRHNFRVGEEKTHRMLCHFGWGSISAGEAERLAKAFNQPLFGIAPASWYVKSGALGEIPAADSMTWPLYERYVRVAFEPNPDFDPNVHDPSFGNSTLLETIERYNFYGWQDYGDIPLDYEPFGPNHAGQMNLKYWYLRGMLVQFCRSADHRWMDLAIPSAWHLADIDYLHIPDTGIAHWVHGAYFGHSQHDEPGCLNPNRNYNSPSVDLFFGVPELLLAYHLTGENRFLDVALEGLQAMENIARFSNFDHPIPYRERANLIFAHMEGYRQTGDSRWLNNLNAIVEKTADLSNKGWVTDPLSYRVPEPTQDERISGFQFAQVFWTLGLYLDFCQEYGLTDPFGVAGALAAFGDFILQHMMREVPERPGKFATVDSIWFMDTPYETYLEVNNWMLTMADALTYAFKYSGERRYLDGAAKLYETGTVDQTWLDDPPVYINSKDLVNSLNWGLVYMNATKEPESAVPGDIGGNGFVDLGDLILGLGVLSGQQAGRVNPGADVDGNGKIGLAECLYIARELSGSPP